MTRSKLVFIDGLPGTGKSTTAQRLWLQLEALGRPARWWYEHEVGHPVFADDDVRAARSAGGEGGRRLLATAHMGWSHLVSAMTDANGTIILESTLFQTTVGTQLLLDQPETEIVVHFDRTMEILQPVAPALIVLRPPDVATAVHSACERRQPWFEQFLLQHLGETPRGRRTGLRNLADAVQFFAELRAITDRLFERFNGPKLSRAQTDSDWSRQQRAVTDFLGLPPPVPGPPLPAATDYAGRFRAEGTGDEWTLVLDAQGLRFDGEHTARLLPHGPDRFALEGACAEAVFERDAAGRVHALTCRGGLPGLPSRWIKV